MNDQITERCTVQETQDRQRMEAMSDFERCCANAELADWRLGALIDAMRSTPHGATSNALEHGSDTCKHYQAVCAAIESGQEAAHWPAWLIEHGKKLLALQADRTTIQTYLTFHDCGKAWALTRDEDGRLHFPDHAQRSAEIWARAGGSALECELMRKDMVLHTINSEEVRVFAADPLAPSLLLAAFAELQSNAASIFGGLDSTSYKIKIKALGRRAKAMIPLLV